MNESCFGRYVHSYNNYSGSGPEIHIYTTERYFTKMFESDKTVITFSKHVTVDKPVNVNTQSKSLTVFSRTGPYSHIFYSRIRIGINDLDPIGLQEPIINSICEEFTKSRRGVFFIHGVSGAGKSTIGLLVASRLHGTYCHTFNPIDPGDTLHHLLRDSEPSDDHPTVILLEEANTLIRAVHTGNIHRHKDVTTCINSKSTYNSFMDDLILYRNVLIIMTSNESKDTMDALDPCYLRKGRVDNWFSMMDVLPL